MFWMMKLSQRERRAHTDKLVSATKMQTWEGMKDSMIAPDIIHVCDILLESFFWNLSSNKGVEYIPHSCLSHATVSFVAIRFPLQQIYTSIHCSLFEAVKDQHGKSRCIPAWHFERQRNDALGKRWDLWKRSSAQILDKKSCNAIVLICASPSWFLCLKNSLLTILLHTELKTDAR